MLMSEYLQNPAGKGSAIGNVAKTREDLKNQYLKLENKIKHKIYVFRKYAIYHIIIPSKDETRDNTYDVIIEFNMNDLTSEAIDISSLDFALFSNCPSFVYTYANVFYNKQMLCKWLLNKYNPQVRKNLPERRNAYNVIGFERSIYLAMLYIKSKHIDRLDVITNTATKVHAYSQISQYVRTQDDIMQSYKKDKLKVTPGTTTSGASEDFKKKSKVQNRGDRTQNTSFISKTKKVSSMAKTSKVRRTKKI